MQEEGVYSDADELGDKLVVMCTEGKKSQVDLFSERFRLSLLVW